MSLATLDLSSASGTMGASAGPLVSRLPGLVLVRLAAAREGLAETELARELHTVGADALGAREWQQKLSEIIATLTAAGLRHDRGAAARGHCQRQGRCGASPRPQKIFCRRVAGGSRWTADCRRARPGKGACVPSQGVAQAGWTAVPYRAERVQAQGARPALTIAPARSSGRACARTGIRWSD